MPALADPPAFRARATEAPGAAFFAVAFLPAAFFAVAFFAVALLAIVFLAAALLAVAGALRAEAFFTVAFSAVALLAVAFFAAAELDIAVTVLADAGPAPVPALAELVALRARAAEASAVAFLAVAFVALTRLAVASRPVASLIVTAEAVERGEVDVLTRVRLDLDSAIASAAVDVAAGARADPGSSAFAAVTAAGVAPVWPSDALVAAPRASV